QVHRRARRPARDDRREQAHGRRGADHVRARVHVRARPVARVVLRRERVKRLLLAVTALFLAFPAVPSARGTVDPSKECEQHDWISIHLGPLDLSITKAVAYLLIGAGLTIVLGLTLMRVRIPGRRQAIGEMIYDVAQTQVAEQGLPHKAIGRW